MASEYVGIKDLAFASQLPPGIIKFDITSIIQHFVEQEVANYRAIKESSFQMFARGYVQVRKTGVFIIL